MVKLNRIYTRTGDDGTTALVNGERRRKSDLRIEAYGTVDETNAAIGLARIWSGQDLGWAAEEDPELDDVFDGYPEVDEALGRIQNDLFDLGADLANPPVEGEADGKALRIVQAQVDRLEQEIDAFNARLEPLKSFVLPGGDPVAAALHVARTVSRRAERLCVALAAEEQVSEPALRYLNRLSDLLFVMARVCNDEGKADVLWVPGQNR